jgi:RND family efflux transporter MFP subunit
MKRISALLFGAVIATTACSGGETRSKDADRQPMDVQMDVATTGDLARSFESGGVVRARTTATLVSRLVADVKDVLVRPGERVMAGQPLIRLDARDLQANRARAEAGAAAAEQAVTAATMGHNAAEAGLALATATHTRIAELRAKNSATPNELDQAVSGLRGAEAQEQGAQAGIRQAESGLVAARAALQAASVGLSYAVIVAPFDGIVTETLVEPGNMAAPGVPLMTIEDVRGFRLEVRIDEARVSEVDRLKPVEIVLDSVAASRTAQDAPLAGRIAEISRAVDPGSHAFLVKIDLPKETGVRSGMFGRARFAGPARRALTVPACAVVRHGQLASAFVVGSDSRARLRMVNAGDSDGSRVEVTAGLDIGERVVTNPPPTLVDGALVREVRR